MKRIIALVVGVLGVGWLVAAPAQAEETTCRGAIGATTLDNVRVPDGAKCVLEGTFVQGTVKVETDAVLVARDVRVVGNVQAENARNTRVVATSRVGGSVQVKQGFAAKVANSKVNADIQYDSKQREARRQGQQGGRQRAGLPELWWCCHQLQPDRWKSPVQGERPGPDGRRQHRPGEQRRPVRRSLELSS